MSNFKPIDELIDPVLADPKRRANVARHRLETVAEIVAYNDEATRLRQSEAMRHWWTNRLADQEKA